MKLKYLAISFLFIKQSSLKILNNKVNPVIRVFLNPSLKLTSRKIYTSYVKKISVNFAWLDAEHDKILLLFLE